MREITLPTRLTEIPTRAFSDCEQLRKVEFPKKLNTIEKGAFSHCCLSDIQLPATLTFIGDFSFAQNKSLKRVIIPKSVDAIGVEAFYGCANLKEVEIENNYTIVGNKAFSGTAWNKTSNKFKRLFQLDD